MAHAMLHSVGGIVEAKPRSLVGDVTVRLNGCIVQAMTQDEEIWTYNLFTEEWRKFTVKAKLVPTFVSGECAVAVGSAIYILEGFMGILWKLARNTDGSFEWNTIDIEDDRKMPSPRHSYCGWEHGGKMWIFGGYGLSPVGPPVGYLNDHGDFKSDGQGWNNQLFCFEPSINTWKNVASTGDVPLPQALASAVIIKDKVWLYDGHSSVESDGLFELNMLSLSWTKVDINFPRRFVSHRLTVAPITQSQIVFYDGLLDKNAWILDVRSHTWTKHQGSGCKCSHKLASAIGLGSDVIIFGGDPTCTCVEPIFSLRLEPKTLEQLATRILHEHREDLPWEGLPQSMIHNMLGT